MYKKITSVVLFLGATAALAAQPPGAIPERLTRPPISNDAPQPNPRGVPLPLLGSSELPPPRLVPSDSGTTPPQQPTPPMFRMAPVIPSPDVEALRSELNHLRQENDHMLKGRRSVLPSEVERPKSGGGLESSLELRLRLANKLAVLRKIREDARGRITSAPPAPGAGSTPTPKGSVPHPTEKGTSSTDAFPEHSDSKESPVDAPGLGRILFLSGDYAKALATYTAIDPAEQRPEDHLLTKYMMACCLRKLGKLDEAEALYREVGNSGGHESLVANAQWHLQTMKGHRELVAELARLRSLRESMTRREE